MIFLKKDGRLPIHADYSQKIIDNLNTRLNYSDFDIGSFLLVEKDFGFSICSAGFYRLTQK